MRFSDARLHAESSTCMYSLLWTMGWGPPTIDPIAKLW